MDLQEATLTMALLMKKEKEFYKKFLEDKDERSDDKIQELRKQFEYIKANTREYGNRLAANPNFFDIMESWQVTITGKEGISEDTMNAVKNKNDSEELINRIGSLAVTVKEYFSKSKLPIRVIDAGEDGWEIGLLCKEKVSRELCRDIYQRFSYAIDLKLLSVSRRFSGHNLPGLYNWEDAERIVKAYGSGLSLEF